MRSGWRIFWRCETEEVGVWNCGEMTRDQLDWY